VRLLVFISTIHIGIIE